MKKTAAKAAKKRAPRARPVAPAKDRLREMELSGEAIIEPRTYFGPLPEVRLDRKVRLDRIIKAAKR